MKRSLQGVVAMLAVCMAVPALAADYFDPELRPAYPEQWENPDDSIRFEVGVELDGAEEVARGWLGRLLPGRTPRVAAPLESTVVA